MTNAEARIVHLEQELRRDELAIAALQAAVAALQQAVRTGQTSPYGGGGGGGTYECNPGVVLNPGSNTGVTVSQRTNAGVTAMPGTYTVYNDMTHATVVTLVVILSSNGDGTFTVVTQSCP